MNTYQTVLATDGNAAYVLFLYGDIQWDREGRVAIGFDSGDFGRGFNLPESESPLNLESTSNVGLPGAYYFRVDQDNITLPFRKCGSQGRIHYSRRQLCTEGTCS